MFFADQTVGRAGRPQYDDSGTAVIMTSDDKTRLYEGLVSGTEVLESSLHCGLLEHINAEVGMNTFKDVQGAIRWLRSTFLYIRLRQNPRHYQITGCDASIDSTLEALCRKDLDSLTEKNLIQQQSTSFRVTAYGDAMAKYYVRFPTSIV